MTNQTEPAFAHGTPAKTGILLVNLGTPDAPTAKAVRPYLKEFLSDPRVVEIPRPIWWLILNGIILNTRPKKSAAKYAKIWMPEGSPLRVHTAKQTMLLHGYLGQRTNAPFVVDYAMRYGNPSIAGALQQTQGTELPAHPGRADVSAICRQFHRDRVRPGIRRECRKCATCPRCAPSGISTTTPATSRRWLAT